MNDHSNKFINEMKELNRKVLMNDTYMNFQSELDQNSYTCCMIMLTCYCGFSKKCKNILVQIAILQIQEKTILYAKIGTPEMKLAN